MSRELKYRVNIDTDRARSDIKNLNDDLREVNEQTDVDLIINNAQAVRSVGELRQRYRELRDAQLQVGEGTEEFARLAQAAGELQNKLNAVTGSSRDLSGSLTENVGASLGTLRQGILNLDLPKVQLAFTQLKQTALTFGDNILRSVPFMNGLTGATRQFGAALVATGVGAFVVTLGLLIANFNKLKDVGGVIGTTFTAIGKAIDFVKNGVINLADAIGLVDKNAIAAGDSIEEMRKREISSAEQLSEATERRLKKLREEALLAFRLSTIQSRAEITRQERLDALKENLQEISAATNKAYGLANKLDIALSEIDPDFDDAMDALWELNDATNILEEDYRRLADALAIVRSVLSTAPESTLKKTFGDDFKEILDLVNSTKKELVQIDGEYRRRLKEERKKQEEEEQAAAKKLAADALKSREAQLKEEERLLKRSYDNQLKDLETLVLQGTITQEEALNERIAFEDAYNEEFIDSTNRIYEQRLEILEESLKQGFITEEEYNRESERLALGLVDAIADANLKRLQNQVELHQELSAINRQAAAADLAAVQAQLEEEQSLYVLYSEKEALRRAREGEQKQDQRLRELEAEREFQIRKLEILEEALHNGVELEESILRDAKATLLQIETDYQNEVRRLEQETGEVRMQIIAMSLQAAQGFTAAVTNLVNTRYQAEIDAAEDNEQRQDELRREAFEKNKQLSLVSAVISTAQAVITAFQAGSSLPGPAGVVMGPVMAALAGVTGAIQIAAIASSQYSGGNRSVPTPPSAPSIPSAEAASPNISFIGAGTGGSVAGQGAEMPMVISTQVSVSETEITSTQGLVSSYESGAGLGGG